MRVAAGRHFVEVRELREGRGPTLLLAHALFGSATDWEDAATLWPGPVRALDFSGHGASDDLHGGAYTPEVLAVDLDVALEATGARALAGAGVGAYVSLLVAGARAGQVAAVALLPGTGLAGGGPDPGPTPLRHIHRNQPGPLAPPDARFDPLVHVLEHDIRPPAYAAALAAPIPKILLARHGGELPPWWRALRSASSAELIDPDWPAVFARLRAVSDR